MSTLSDWRLPMRIKMRGIILWPERFEQGEKDNKIMINKLIRHEWAKPPLTRKIPGSGRCYPSHPIPTSPPPAPALSLRVYKDKYKDFNKLGQSRPTGSKA